VRTIKPSGLMKPVIGVDSAEVTAVDHSILGAGAAAAAAASPPPLVIESVKQVRSEDDDPTTLVVRDEMKPGKGDSAGRGLPVAQALKSATERRNERKTERKNERSGALAVPREAAQLARDDESGAPTVEEKAIVESSSEARPGAGSRAIWIAIALILLGAAGVAAAHYLGIIK
jgi:hypothetical protein